MKNKVFTKPIFILAALVAIGAGAGISALVSAQTSSSAGAKSGMHMMGRGGPGVMGTVSSVTGTTILVAAKDGTTYTVDASGAKFLKRTDSDTPPTTPPTPPPGATIADIKVGDTVGIKGTVTGTSVKAEMVMDGVPPMGMGGTMGAGHWDKGVHGTVSAVNGTSVTFTVTDSSTIKVGDDVIVVPKKQ
jgi:hypothetical protein